MSANQQTATDNVTQALVSLAKRLSGVYVARCAARAVLLAGSTAEGLADEYSDLDIIAYYEGAIPDEAQLQAVRAELRVESFRHVFPRGMPLHGADLIEGLQARCTRLPDALARAMVEHYLRQTMPLWYFADALDRRDASLWVHQTLATNALNVIGIVAALNRRFYSTFQFKRMRHFVASLPIAPPNFADRLDMVVAGDQRHGIEVLEELIRDVLQLVQRHLPDANTSALRRPPHSRQQPWHVADLEQ
jgi:hypothetical protein